MATVIDFTRTGGMHFAQNDLAKMQEAYREGLSAIAHLCGDLVILYGMVDNGSSYSPGAVAINGEILPFSGGGKLPNLAIEETKSGNTFRDGVVQEIYTLRKVVTTSVGGYPVSSFTRLSEIKNKANLVDGKVPISELPAMNTYRRKGSVQFYFSDNSKSTGFNVRHDLNTTDIMMIGNVRIFQNPPAYVRMLSHSGVSFYIDRGYPGEIGVEARVVKDGDATTHRFHEYYFDYILL